MTRKFWVLLHRYASLTMAVFLIIASLTGSVLAFYPELDEWVHPEYRVAVQNKPPLDPMTLCEKALALEPRGQFQFVRFEPPLSNGAPFSIAMLPRIDPVTGKPFEGMKPVRLNPYTGVRISSNEKETIITELKAWPLTRDNILPVIYSLHTMLLMDSIGLWIMGIAATIWTVDCFVGFYLTLPVRQRNKNSPFSQWERVGMRGNTSLQAVDAILPRGKGTKSFWQRWQVAWLIKWPTSAPRLNFDLHRAGGLWTWPLLFVFAWSSVMFNLNEQVYKPVMNFLFEMPENHPLPELDQPLVDPPIGVRAAFGVGQKLMSLQAKQNGFTIEWPTQLMYLPEIAKYDFCVRSSLDIKDKYGNTCLSFDARTGRFLSFAPPTGQTLGGTLETWITELHMASIWGLPYKIVVCLMGLVITMLSVTGVYIWLKKRQASKSKPRKVLTEARIKIQP